MRIFVFCTLALAGVAVLADAAEAGPFRRGRNRGNDCCPTTAAPAYAGGYGGWSGVGMPGAGYGVGMNPCGGTMTAGYPGGYSGAYPGAWQTGGTGAWTGGQNVVQTTDGKVYIRNADGTYYAASDAGYGGQFQPGSYPGYYPGMQLRYPGYQGVMPAGYPGYYPGGYYPGVTPAGGPIIMPNPIPNPMPK